MFFQYSDHRIDFFSFINLVLLSLPTLPFLLSLLFLILPDYLFDMFTVHFTSPSSLLFLVTKDYRNSGPISTLMSISVLFLLSRGVGVCCFSFDIVDVWTMSPFVFISLQGWPLFLFPSHVIIQQTVAVFEMSSWFP